MEASIDALFDPLQAFLFNLWWMSQLSRSLIQLTTFLLGDKYGLVTLYSKVFLFLPLLYTLSLTDLSCACIGGLQVQELSSEAINYLV